jgi:hypothetical protein
MLLILNEIIIKFIIVSDDQHIEKTYLSRSTARQPMSWRQKPSGQRMWAMAS